MKLLIDENLSPRVAILLREAGVDAVPWSELASGLALLETLHTDKG